MSPAIADDQSRRQSKPTNLPNPNPNPKTATESKTNLNFSNASDLGFDCSHYVAAPPKVTSRRRKAKRVKKQSGTAVSTFGFNSDAPEKFDNLSFEFGANTVSNSSLGHGEKPPVVDFEKFKEVDFSSNSSEDIFDSRSGVGIVGGDEKGCNLGNFMFCFSGGTTASQSGGDEFGKFHGARFMFAAADKSSNVPESGEIRDQSDSILLKSMSSLNLGMEKASKQFQPSSDESRKEDADTDTETLPRKCNDFDFVFSASGGNIGVDFKSRKEESKENEGDPTIEEIGRTNFDAGARFVFSPGWSNSVSNSTSDQLKSNKKAGGSESLDDNIGVIGNSSNTPVFCIHDPAKGSAADKTADKTRTSNSDVFVFGGNNKTTSSTGISGKENQPANLNDKNSDNGHFFGNQPKSGDLRELSPSLSSSTDPCFVPRVDDSEATPVNRVEKLMTDFSFGASFSGFSTRNFKTSGSFKANLFPGSSKMFEFSANSVGEKKLRQTRAKLKQKQRTGRTNLSKESNSQPNQVSHGCFSPMDVSPYQSTDSAPPSIDPPINNKDTADTKSGLQVPLSSERSSEINVSISATSPSQVDVPTNKQRRLKKYKMNIGNSSASKTANRRGSFSSAQCHGESTSNSDEAANQEACNKWRIRGNQAYKDGDQSKAEIYYTKGIHSFVHARTSILSKEPLILCYSNRAATRMTLGRVREALEDCRMAAALDPNFIKVHFRAANCHLVLGEVEDALLNYNKCLESGNNVCLDRRITIEAADGLKKAQKVATCMSQIAELLHHKTFDSASNAFRIISDALSISCYSEKLLEMKGDALLILQKHEEVVQLCEETLDFASRNFSNVNGYDSKNLVHSWRWNLMSKSYFHMGRLEMAVDILDRQEQSRREEDKTKELSIPLADTIRELLRCKNAGNEAFQSGRHTEAVEHYTTAISKSIESRPFAAVCFCNRAAARQSLGEVIDAISDCCIALALDGSYSKALSRRATLHEMIRDYEQAANDLRRLVSILEMRSEEKSHQSSTPGRSTGSSVKDLRRARCRLSSVDEKSKKETTLDLYLILGLKAEDSASEIKKAYRRAALRHHPDKAGQFLARSESGADGPEWKLVAETIHTDADKLFKMIGEAYAVLSDSTKRSKYDLEEGLRHVEEEIPVSSSFRRTSGFHTSPFDNRERRQSQESHRTYGNSYYRNW